MALSRYAGASSLGLIIVIGVVSYFLINIKVPDTVAAILSAGITIAFSHAHTRQREIEANQRTHKTIAYDAFSDFIFNKILVKAHMIMERNEPIDMHFTTSEITEYVMNVGKGLSMWGSDEILLSYADFIGNLSMDKVDAPPQDIFDECAKLLLMLRQDLGYKNLGIDESDIRCIFGFKNCKQKRSKQSFRASAAPANSVPST